MKLIKTKPKFRCDYCSYSATERRMAKHELICWKNPDRYCENCKNTGNQVVDTGGGYWDQAYYEPCFFCSQYDEEKFGRILEENEI